MPQRVFKPFPDRLSLGWPTPCRREPGRQGGHRSAVAHPSRAVLCPSGRPTWRVAYGRRSCLRYQPLRWRRFPRTRHCLRPRFRPRRRDGSCSPPPHAMHAWHPKNPRLTIQIERVLSKEEILELYLNKIYLGHRAYGAEAAAQVYYGKSCDICVWCNARRSHEYS